MAITYEQFRTMLPIHKHRLDDELEIHAQLQEQISHETTLRNSRMLEAKEDLAKTEARVADDLREDDPKLTVAAVQAKLYTLHPRFWRGFVPVLSHTCAVFRINQLEKIAPLGFCLRDAKQ